MIKFYLSLFTTIFFFSTTVFAQTTLIEERVRIVSTELIQIGKECIRFESSGDLAFTKLYEVTKETYLVEVTSSGQWFTDKTETLVKDSQRTYSERSVRWSSGHWKEVCEAERRLLSEVLSKEQDDN